MNKHWRGEKEADYRKKTGEDARSSEADDAKMMKQELGESEEQRTEA